MASEKHSAKTEYDRKVRERERREQNYQRLKSFTEHQARQAKRELEPVMKRSRNCTETGLLSTKIPMMNTRKQR